MVYIPTGENIAGLMTKHLKKATHDYLCNKLLYKLHDGKVYHFGGKPLTGDFPQHTSYRDKLVEIPVIYKPHSMRIALMYGHLRWL